MTDRNTTQFVVFNRNTSKDRVIPSASRVDTVDWREERSAQTILDAVLSNLKPGSIILSHNNGYKIKEYLPVLIEKAQADGYEFVTVSELLLSGDTIIDVNGVQKAHGKP